tara:strand:- start:1024 stop:1737 length:714 start_codon:yes stop_codon:yes gene_type:complete
MAFNFGNKIEGTAYAILNEIFGVFRGKGGFSRPSRYEVILVPPAGTNSNLFSSQMQEFRGDDTIKQTSLACESISFPGRNIDTTEDTNIYGPVRNIATGFSYADITATFRCSRDMREKRYFETWQKLSYNPATWSMQYYEDYVGAVQIFQLDDNDERTYGVELIEAFPKTIEAQQLDYSSTDQINKLNVTFSYRWWKSLADEANLPQPLQDRINQILASAIETQITANIPKVLSKLG